MKMRWLIFLLLFFSPTAFAQNGNQSIPASSGSGTVTTTGTPSSGQLTKFSGSTSITNGNLAGDCTTSGSLTLTCVAINGTVFSSLGSGILYNTTGTGVPSIATSSNVLSLWTGTCSSSTYLRGDGACAAPSGSGTVTSVAQSFTGGLISVSGSPITGSGTLALTVAGTSGGVPCFTSTSAWASSSLLPSGDFVLGGGAGACPTATFSVVPVANGGTGTGSTLTGLVRGNASAMTAAELSGDVTTSGSNVTTVVQIEGAAIPASATLIGTNSSKQAIAAALASADIYVGNGSNLPVAVAVSGDVSMTNTGAFTVTKINGTALSGLATGVLYNTTTTGVPSIATSAQILSACTGCAPLASPTFSGTPSLPTGTTATTQTACDNSTKLATTAYTGTVCNNVETSGSPLTASAQSQTIWNNTASAYVVDLPTPTASGPEICIGNYKARSSAVSLVPGSGVTIYFKGVAGTSGSSTGLVSGGAAGDFICVEGTDSTTYEAIGAGYGTFTNN